MSETYLIIFRLIEVQPNIFQNCSERHNCEDNIRIYLISSLQQRSYSWIDEKCWHRIKHLPLSFKSFSNVTKLKSFVNISMTTRCETYSKGNLNKLHYFRSRWSNSILHAAHRAQYCKGYSSYLRCFIPFAGLNFEVVWILSFQIEWLQKKSLEVKRLEIVFLSTSTILITTV